VVSKQGQLLSTTVSLDLHFVVVVGDRKQIIHSFVDREQQNNKNNINTQQQQFRSWAGMILYTLQPGGRDICWCSKQHTKKQYEQQTKAKQN